MAFCPNCGSNNENIAKFCINCGGPLPAAQQAPQAEPVSQAASQPQPAPAPVQQPQSAPQPSPAPQPQTAPVQQPAPQPAPIPQAPAGFTPIPAPPANGGFRPITPENPLPMTPIQPVYAQPITQPVQKQLPKPKTNGFCKAGFIFSIIGLCSVGSTSLLGLILSVIGLFSAKKHNQPGKGKAVFGIICSGVIVLGLGVTIAMCWSDLREDFESGSISDPIEFFYALDGSNERHTKEYQEKTKNITGQNWVNSLSDNNAYLVFGNGNTFKFYEDVDDTSDNYITGKCRIFLGTDAMDQVERKYRNYITKSDINKLISRNSDYKRENFVLMVMTNDCNYKNGKKINDGNWTTTYYGFCYKTISGTYRFVMIDMETGTKYDFATEKYFKGNRSNQG